MKHLNANTRAPPALVRSTLDWVQYFSDVLRDADRPREFQERRREAQDEVPEFAFAVGRAFCWCDRVLALKEAWRPTWAEWHLVAAVAQFLAALTGLDPVPVSDRLRRLGQAFEALDRARTCRPDPLHAPVLALELEECRAGVCFFRAPLSPLSVDPTATTQPSRQAMRLERHAELVWEGAEAWELVQESMQWARGETREGSLVPTRDPIPDDALLPALNLAGSLLDLIRYLDGQDRPRWTCLDPYLGALRGARALLDRALETEEVTK